MTVFNHDSIRQTDRNNWPMSSADALTDRQTRSRPFYFLHVALGDRIAGGLTPQLTIYCQF